MDSPSTELLGLRSKALKLLRPPHILLFSGLAIVGLACGIPAILGKSQPRCSPPPEGFSESILVGNWRAGRPAHYDELSISRDGTYTQRVHVEYPEAPPLDFQGERHGWRLEYSDAGIPYLHLENFRFCGMNSEIPCQETHGDGYDICRDEWVDMNGEGILILLGTNTDSSPETQVYHYLHYPMGSENSWVYAHQDQ